MSYKASLIISVYKETRFLKAVLDSLPFQTERNFEVIISEDGEDASMKSFIDSYPFVNDHKHLTQEDVGWRKNKALNRAIAAASSEWIIFIDGDCILHPRFIEYHLRRAGSKKILSAKKVKLNDNLSRMLLKDISSVNAIQKNLYIELFSIKKRDIGFIEEGIFINPLGPLGLIPALRSMRQLKGCNMSFSKSAACAINGFDEDYVDPLIGEDIDLSWRFRKAGYRICSLRNIAVEYHLNHKENWNPKRVNMEKMEAKMKNGDFFCLNGLNKYEGVQSQKSKV
ncbi:MAG TPA: glycosyltransferase [Bacteroidales bacterium]|nr:glycosyltransferase [Bacteroidales bacterium]HPT12665.1 glycosyltransferase [Bacteroidales bacterium]